MRTAQRHVNFNVKSVATGWGTLASDSTEFLACGLGLWLGGPWESPASTWHDRASPSQLGMPSWLAFGDPSDGTDPEGIVGRETRPSEGPTPGNPKGRWHPLALVTLRGRLRQSPLPSFGCSFMPVGSCCRRGRVRAFNCARSWARASFSHLFLDACVCPAPA